MSEGYTDVREYVNWRDGGCDLNPSCLSCPLPKCIEEEPRGRQRRRLDGRSSAMKLMRRQGKSVREIAGTFMVSVRTVQRALQGRKMQKPNSKIQTIPK